MYTILGSTGFVGSNLKDFLIEKGEEVFCPPRNFIPESGKNYGNVIYCIGLTSDFREKPSETIEAHVSLLNKLITNLKFESFIYLSSTRIYQHSNSTHEDDFIYVNPNIKGDLYNISKLMGESICLSNDNENIKVVRLSNVIGNDFNSGNFFYSILEHAINESKIELSQSLESSKDYIHISDVLSLIYKISKNGKERVYNLATGYNVANKELIDLLSKQIEFNLSIRQPVNNLVFNNIEIGKIKQEFGFNPEPIIRILDKLITKRLNQK